MPSVGEHAPDFTLPNQDKQPVTLSDLHGRPIMLVFFPLAFSTTCTAELCAIRDDYAAYERRGVTVLGISVDSTHALRAWLDGLCTAYRTTPSESRMNVPRSAWPSRSFHTPYSFATCPTGQRSERNVFE